MGKTYVSIIVDESGSMHSLRESAISMFNAQLEAIKSEAKKTEQETLVTLIKFNNKYKVVLDGASIDDVVPLENKDYLPNGGTAMYDTIVHAIEKQVSKWRLEKDDAVLFIIITDGEENSSDDHPGNNGLYYLKGMMSAVELTGQWTITFMGTEDALREAKRFNMSANTLYSMDMSPQGLSRSTADSVSSIGNFYNARSRGVTSQANFFGGTGMEVTPEVTREDK